MEQPIFNPITTVHINAKIPLNRATKSLSIRLGMVLFLSASFFSLTLPILAAGPGDLDVSFGNGGVITTTLGSSSGVGAVVIQSDGKIVVAGDGDLLTFFGVARYNSNGGLDHSFGSNGVITTPIGSSAYGTAIVLQPDDKIVVAGTSSNGSQDMFALARYANIGSLDSGFGSSGIVTTPIGIEARGRAVAQQSDGKIIVAGDSFDGSQTTIALARYTITGNLDSDFGSSGVVTTLIDSDAFGYAIALQPDGKIIVVGGSGNRHSQSYFALARYTTTGSLDSDFGNSGVVTTPIGTYGSGYGVALQADDKIVVVGYTIYGISSPPAVFALVRYNSNGNLDNGFGHNGVVTTPIGSQAYGNAVVLDPDDKIIAVGYSSDDFGVNSSFALVRYDSNGNLDSGFGSNGVVTTSISSIAAGNTVAIQSDSKIVVAGNCFDGAQNSYALARYISKLSTYLPVIFKQF